MPGIDEDGYETAMPLSGEPFTLVCRCDFCTGAKRWEDNWCARCANVQLQPPKRWEDCEVCDACDEAIMRELAEEQAQRPGSIDGAGAPPTPALLSVYTAACALVDRDGPLVEADRLRDPLCVAVDAARGMTAREAIEARMRMDEQ